MKTLSFGIIPDSLSIDEPYYMRLMGNDFLVFAGIVNQGIDSHLEAVFVEQNGREFWIKDTASLKCLLRRCVESGNEDAESLASDIMSTLGYEWV